jgi:diadenosine tetraphosphate (Ap4A) HIT family hydrolase
VTVAGCPFCDQIAEGAFEEHEANAVAFPDGYPLSKGHTLVVPRRHLADVFALEPFELQELLQLVVLVKTRLAAAHHPDGFNVGVNVGAAAGQTVDHAHVHVIPRYAGDREDPRGGVRWVLPERAAYWKPAVGR